jgi:galactose-1-phosphate uridylyltransferase
MSEYNKYFMTLKDGTLKQINPFTGTEVWNVPGRGSKPITNEIPSGAKKIENKGKEGFCNFCETKYINTPPEKERLIKKDGKYSVVSNVLPADLDKTDPVFRRIPNLFEIVTMDYWKKNFGYEMPEEIQAAKKEYMADKKGNEHVMHIVDMKLKLLGRKPEEAYFEEKMDIADAFFAGGHELIVGKKHFIEGAEFDTQLCSSGELTPEEHFEYLKFTIKGMLNIYKNNQYVRYVAVFQNWLKPAGASFDHLHKQLVAIDEWGVSLERERSLIRQNPNIYNEMGANLALYFNLIIAENDYAIAFADIGHRYPTIAIFLKSDRVHPYDLEDQELKGFSDILHAVHSALTSQIAANEEWYYTPKDSVDVMPWHILIKMRVNTPAGFEGGTKIYINPINPYDLRDKIITRLISLRDENKIAKISVGKECSKTPNPLKYYTRYYKA